MQQIKTPVSKVKMILMWLFFVGFSVACIAFVLWRHRNGPGPAEPEPGYAHAFVLLFVGGFLFVAGAVSYLILLTTNCFLFNFSKPVWDEVKGRMFLANIVVLTGFALGLGFITSPIAGPLLVAAGISQQTAFVLPVLAMVMILQIARIFILLWAPLERQLISKRLQARGITPAQLQSAFLVGISNPERSSFKKFSQVEEDIGAIWVGPEQLVYYGDTEDFAVTRGQLLQTERKADTGGTTLLGGITHLILHVQQSDGSERQIRFHTEGHWTMGAKGKAMDELEQAILNWHSSNLPTTN
jgi:hypothetical protein